MSKIPSLIRKHVREELHGTYTIAIAIVEDVDEQNRRVEVSMKDDEEVLIDEIPIASGLAGDGYGELYPLVPGETEGLLLFNKEPITDQIQQRGPIEVKYQRQHSFQDAFFFPQFFFDEDTVPEHDAGDYLLAHPSGTYMWIKEDGTYLVDHPSGMQFEIGENVGRAGEHMYFTDGEGSRIELDNNPEPHEELEQEYNIEWPEEHLKIAHKSGIALTFTDDGMHLSTIEDELETEPHQRPEDTRASHGELSDPHRIEMTGHRHLVPQPGGATYLLSEPPLSSRLMFDTILNPERQGMLENFDYEKFLDLEMWYEDYLAWLQSETGESLDPIMPRDAKEYPDYQQDQWVDVEPIPTAEEMAEWGPDN